jgi:hypothetical protein
MRLRARDHDTPSTLIGGKGGAGPSSLLHTTPEGPTEYVVNAMWIMFHGQLDYSQKPLLEVGLTHNWETVTHNR